MSDHLIAEANRHAKALLKTTPKMNSKINPDRLALAFALETVEQLERENAALERENAALRKDKERLDWIIGRAHYLFFKELGSDLVVGREQIDAARKEAQP